MALSRPIKSKGITSCLNKKPRVSVHVLAKSDVALRVHGVGNEYFVDSKEKSPRCHRIVLFFKKSARFSYRWYYAGFSNHPRLGGVQRSLKSWSNHKYMGGQRLAYIPLMCLRSFCCTERTLTLDIVFQGWEEIDGISRARKKVFLSQAKCVDVLRYRVSFLVTCAWRTGWAFFGIKRVLDTSYKA